MAHEFAFYEIVRVRDLSGSPNAEVSGLEGAVVGKSTEKDGSVVAYAVSLYERKRVSMFTADEIEPTGRFDRRETFYDGTSIRVSARGEYLGPLESDGD